MRACIIITTCWLGLVLAELLVASISLKWGLLICSFVLCVRCVIDPGTGSKDIPASHQGEIRKKNTSRLLRLCSHDEYYRDGNAHAWYVRDIFRTLLCHCNHDNLSQKCLLIAFLSPFWEDFRSHQHVETLPNTKDVVVISIASDIPTTLFVEGSHI